MKLKHLIKYLDTESDKAIFIDGEYKCAYSGLSSNKWLEKERGNLYVEKIRAGIFIGHLSLNIYLRTKR